jgi:Na+-translocating ferredoxin:NAD+ oxidoreductase RnfA subunit
MSDEKGNFPTDAVESIESRRGNSEIMEEKKIIVKKGIVDSISIYEVSESELIILETGSPNSLYLNFFTFLLATFLSFLTSLLTANFDNKDIVQTIFIFISVVSGFLTIIFLILWLRGKNQFSDVVKRIKGRIK